MARRPRANKAGNTEREWVTAQIVYESATRVFFCVVKFESDDGPDKFGPFATAHAATDACLTHIDQVLLLDRRAQRRRGDPRWRRLGPLRELSERQV